MSVNTNYGVSVTDVLVHDLFKDLDRDPIHPKFDDERALKKALWDFGLDIHLEINEVNCTHRNLQNQVVTCIMYRGAERTDPEWLKSGCASLEAVKASTQDYSLKQELDNMRNKG